jgi:hypothetical protein
MVVRERKEKDKVKLDEVNFAVLPVAIKSRTSTTNTAIKFTLSRKKHAHIGDFKHAIRLSINDDIISHGISVFDVEIEVMFGETRMFGVETKWSEYLEDFLSPPSAYTMRGAIISIVLNFICFAVIITPVTPTERPPSRNNTALSTASVSGFRTSFCCLMVLCRAQTKFICR